MNKLSIMIYCC